MVGDIRVKTLPPNQKRLDDEYEGASPESTLDKLPEITPELDEVVLLIRRVRRRYVETMGSGDEPGAIYRVLEQVEKVRGALERDYRTNWKAYERFGWEIKHDPVYEIVVEYTKMCINLCDAIESLIKNSIIPMEDDFYALIAKLETHLKTIAAAHSRVVKELEVCRRENQLAKKVLEPYREDVSS